MTRLYAQYADKPKAVQWYNILPNIATELTDGLNQVRLSWDIDNATSAELDVIGRIVVIDRGYESSVEFTPDTQFGGSNSESQFGGLYSQFESTGDILTQEVSDEIYRLLIKAKISKNNNDATIDGIIEALQFITNSDNIQVTDNEDMSFDVIFNSSLSPTQRFVFNTFDVVPKPQGVRFNGYLENPALTQFGDADNEFGDVESQFTLYFGA